MSTFRDYTAWRCHHDDGDHVDIMYCPEEGCTKKDGCFRDRTETKSEQKSEGPPVAADEPSVKPTDIACE